MRTRILLLTQFFYPDKLSTGKVLAELFLELDKKIFEITAVAGKRMYQDPVSLLSDSEVVQGIHVYRGVKRQFSKNKAFGRLYNYCSFFLFACCYVLTRGLYKKADIIFSVSNPPIMPLLGAFLRTRKRKFIYLIHDLYPDIAIKMKAVNEKSILAQVMFRINQYVFSKADALVVLGRDMKQYIVQNYNVNEEKIEVITNWGTSNGRFVSSKSNDKFTIVYAGNIGRFHSFDLVIDAAALLKDRMQLIFIGEGAQKEHLVELVSQKKLENVTFLGYVSDEEYNKRLSEADALLLSLEKGLTGLAVPSKFYMYLAFGKPIIAIADATTEVAMTIAENSCGITVSHDNLNLLLEELLKLINSNDEWKLMGDNAYKTFLRNYQKTEVIKQYENLFLRLCEKKNTFK